MFSLKNFKLSTRIILLGMTIIIAFVLLIAWIRPQIRTLLFQSRQKTTQFLLETTTSIVQYYAKQVTDKVLTEEKAKELARATIRELRYEGSNYYFVLDFNGYLLVHPKLEGKTMIDFKDINNKYFVKEFVEVCKTKNEGFVDYYWPKIDKKTGKEKLVLKISYVKLFPAWNWILSTGIYVDDVDDEMFKLDMILLITGFSIMILCIILSFIMARSLSKPIYSVIEGLETSASEVTVSAKELSTGSQNLAVSASDQAMLMEKTINLLQDVTKSSVQTGELASSAEILMNENLAKSAQSLKALVDLTKNMTEIDADSDKISQIVKTIDGIAFQTNLLALNAAVEAARAGEAGAGFAVVADEVRNLAMRTAEAAKSTQELLDTTVKRIAQASSSIRNMNSDFEGIVESATTLGEKTASITESNIKQKEHFDDIQKMSGKVAESAQQVASTSEEAAAASEELTAQANDFQIFINDLLAIVMGEKNAEKLSNEYTDMAFEENQSRQ